MKISKSMLIVRSAVPVSTTVGSEIVLMTLASGECFGLGETGSEVWRLLAEPTTVEQVTAKLLETYNAPAEVIEADVTALLEELAAYKLVELPGA